MKAEKSNIETGAKWPTSMDSINNHIRKYDDFIVSVGMGLLIISLFKAICVISLLQ